MKFTYWFIISTIMFASTQTMAAEYKFRCTAPDDHGPATIHTKGNTCTGAFVDDENKSYPITTCSSKDGTNFDITVSGVDPEGKPLTYTCKFKATKKPDESELKCDHGYKCKPDHSAK